MFGHDLRRAGGLPAKQAPVSGPIYTPMDPLYSCRHMTPSCGSGASTRNRCAPAILQVPLFDNVTTVPRAKNREAPLWCRPGGRLPHDLRHEHGQAGPRSRPPVAVLGMDNHPRNSYLCRVRWTRIIWRASGYESHFSEREGDPDRRLLWSRPADTPWSRPCASHAAATHGRRVM